MRRHPIWIIALSVSFLITLMVLFAWDRSSEPTHKFCQDTAVGCAR